MSRTGKKLRNCSILFTESAKISRIRYTLDATEPDQSINLVKPGVEFPSLSSFNRVEPKKLTLARRKGLFKDVYSVLLSTRTDMSEHSRNWWTNEVIKDIDSPADS